MPIRNGRLRNITHVDCELLFNEHSVRVRCPDTDRIVVLRLEIKTGIRLQHIAGDREATVSRITNASD